MLKFRRPDGSQCLELTHFLLMPSCFHTVNFKYIFLPNYRELGPGSYEIPDIE